MPKKTASPGAASPPRNNDGDGHSIKNEILLTLPPQEADEIIPHLEFVRLKLHTVLHEAGEEIKSVFFPNTGLQSVLVVQPDGRSVEVALIGKEGFVGIPIIAGFRSSSTRVITQGEATAYRINTGALHQVLPGSPQLERAMQRFAQYLALQSAQIAACNCLHDVQERLARWILMCRDRMASDKLFLTQEFLAQMLGTRRASVSVAASALQKGGSIIYSRGSITVLNNAKLQHAACDCYESIQRQLANWREEST